MAWDDLTADDLPSGRELNEAIVAATLPAGPTPTISSGQADPQPGATITATWTNVGGTSGLDVAIEWLRNGATWLLRPLAPGSTGDNLVTTGWQPGDTVQARVRYQVPSGRLAGPGITDNDDIYNNSEVGAAVLLDVPLAPALDCSTRGEILAASRRNGAFGAHSNTITLS